MFDFLNFSFVDVLDILLVATLLYEIYRLIRGTAAMSIFIAILLLYGVWIAATALNMTLLTAIMKQVLGVGLIALVVIFQPEIRRFLTRLGGEIASARSKNNGRIRNIFRRNDTESEISAEALEELTSACRRMAYTHTGALIVMQRHSSLEYIIRSGDVINSDINRRLIENIFFKNTPMHDGAMIISPTKIIAVRCTLPISENININPRYGMRHRAAAGVTENTDAHAIVVSEETGEISYVAAGEIRPVTNNVELRLAIENFYKS
ncbi:MAG: TIGR00159 family protein [Bacteroidales bacterium]|nr:TIGR00159 family protein [Bacteroidales bacterium]